MADLGLVQHHEFSMSYLCTHGGGLRRELESGESTVNAFFPKLINKLGVILWFNGFLRIMRWQTKSLHKSRIMHESVSCMDALCKMYYRSLAFLRNSSQSQTAKCERRLQRKSRNYHGNVLESFSVAAVISMTKTLHHLGWFITWVIPAFGVFRSPQETKRSKSFGKPGDFEGAFRFQAAVLCITSIGWIRGKCQELWCLCNEKFERSSCHFLKHLHIKAVNLSGWLCVDWW